MCLLSLLDEECRFPNGSDASFAAKVRKTHKEDDFFAVPRFSQTGFTVKHYAGTRFPPPGPNGFWAYIQFGALTAPFG